MARREKKEKYDSLWEDEKEKKAYDDPQEVAENASAGPAGPSIVDAADLTGGSSA